MAITHRVRTLLKYSNDPNFDSPLLGGARSENKSERSWPNGTGDGEMNQVYDETHEIAAGASLTLDLATSGGLKQPDGTPVAMVKLKALIIRKSSGDGSFEVEIPAAGVLHLAATGDKTQVFSGTDDAYAFVSYGGVTVTAATADEIQINETGGANTVTVHVTALGDSA